MKEGRTKRGIAGCCETSVRRHERYCKAVVSKRRAVHGGGRERMKEGRTKRGIAGCCEQEEGRMRGLDVARGHAGGNVKREREREKDWVAMTVG